MINDIHVHAARTMRTMDARNGVTRDPFLNGVTTADRSYTAAMINAQDTDHRETYGTPRPNPLPWRVLVAGLLLLLALWGMVEGLTMLSAPAQVADHCAEVLSAGPSDHPEALYCAQIIHPN